MELILTCPESLHEYSTDQYSLKKGYQIVTEDNGERRLAGELEVHTPCPHCGNNHSYNIEDIACPLQNLKI